MGLFDRLRKKQTTLQQAGSTGADQTFASAQAKSSAPAKAAVKATAKTATATPTTVAASTKRLSARRILLRPLVTEKTTLTSTYAFAVHPAANKPEVSKAVESLYGVRPSSVRIMNMNGKAVRWAYRAGKRKDWKKAIVRLPAGSTINLYEGI